MPPHTIKLLIVLGIALALRCGAAFVLQQQLEQRRPIPLCLISGDAEGYWELAQKLSAGETYAIYEPPRLILRMPGFPLLLAACIKLFGQNHLLAVRMVLAAVGTLACGLIYWLGRELFDRETALIATTFAAISPPLVGFSVLILSETLFAATILASLIGLARLSKLSLDPALRWRGIARAVVAGILLAGATYVRPSWLLVGPVFAAAYTAFAILNREAWLRSIAVLLGLGLSLAPWTYRNYVVSGHFVPTTLWYGASLYDGLNPTATGDSDMRFFELDGFNRTHSEYETDQHYRAEAWRYLREHPQRAAQLALAKAARYWSPWPNAAQFRNPVLQLVVVAFFLPTFLFAAVYLITIGRGGWTCLLENKWSWLLTLAPILYFAALHMLFVGSIRYRLPAESPFLLLSAAGAKLFLPARSTD